MTAPKETRATSDDSSVAIPVALNGALPVVEDRTGSAARMEQGLTDSEEKLRSIVALAGDAIISTDENFRITLFNTAAERIFGYGREEVLGQSLDLLLPESARVAHHAHVDQFARAAPESKDMGARGQIWGRRRSGELFPAEASVSKIRLSGSMHFTAVLRDVSKQRRAEEEREALLIREMDARAAAESAERRFEFLARATDVLHGSLAFETTYRALLQLIVPELALFCFVDIVGENGVVNRLHVAHGDPGKQVLADQLHSYAHVQTSSLTRHALTTGKAELLDRVTDDMLASRVEDTEHLEILRALTPASLMIVPLCSRERVLGAILFARDASGIPYDAYDLALAMELSQRAASALDNNQLYNLAQRAVRARDDVLGVVSHDLRNPLSVISMCVESLLTQGSGDDERTRDVMRTVQQSTRWAQRLIQDLLDVTSIEAGGLSVARQMEDPVVLVTKAALFLEELAAERSITLVTELPEHLPLVHADADRILQALWNLVGNAIKFTPLGGVIRLGATAEAHHVRIFVADNGPGIPLEDVPDIFDRFWTARGDSRVRGAGMGLAIVRGIVDAHGGRVWVEQSPEGGAMFNLTLRVAPSGAADAR